ncbi:MAG: hypothetical protein HY698_14590 [Deltaproteobacteria bacterium]|nr:hypothetical protein [Deltaproteobacteria bacterium]
MAAPGQLLRNGVSVNIKMEERIDRAVVRLPVAGAAELVAKSSAMRRVLDLAVP